MSDGATHHVTTRMLAAEFAGTFALVFMGPGAVMLSAHVPAVGNVTIAAAFGVIVALIVFLFGNVSGAHINPAVTLGLWSLHRPTQHFRLTDVGRYVVVQCAGAIAASFLLGRLLGDVAHYGATIPSVAVPSAWLIEAGYSAVLGGVIVLVALRGLIPTRLVPLAIGLTVFVGAWLTGPLTGGSFNPARSLGPAVAGHEWQSHWLYWVAPIVGMIGGMQLAYRTSAPSDRKAATG